MSHEIELTEENISGKVLDHLGLVKSTIDKLDLVKKIDARLPLAQSKQVKVTMGERVAAMIMNGLGFSNDRLYMFPDFLANKPIERLFREGISAEDFNDDALGRCLDSIHEYGTTQLFSELAFPIGQELGLLGASSHVDSTSLTLYGAYTPAEESVSKGVSPMVVDKVNEETPTASEQSPLDSGLPMQPPVLNKEINVTYGHSKAHRPDLKQVVLNLATTGAAGFPIWMESHSGNTSDQRELHATAQRMQAFCQELKASPRFMHVADSAMYASCVDAAAQGSELRWLVRVPERSNWVQELLQHDDEFYNWQELGNGYRMHMTETTQKGVQQRLCVITSEQAYQRENKTFEKNLAKQQEKNEKALWHLSCQLFGCEKDALKAVEKLIKSWRYHSVEVNLETMQKHTGKGRPKKGAEAQTVGYKVKGKVIARKETIERTRNQKGRFLLSTNEFDKNELADNNILSEYKEQSKTENGFRFIKDPSFEVASVFLKTPSRISALMSIMTLCLMVYSVAQHSFRESLKEVDLATFDPEEKLGKKPSLKKAFKVFRGVQELTISLGEHVKYLVVNLNDLANRIIRCFGVDAMRIYALSG